MNGFERKKFNSQYCHTYIYSRVPGMKLVTKDFKIDYDNVQRTYNSTYNTSIDYIFFFNTDNFWPGMENMRALSSTDKNRRIILFT